MSFCPVNFYAVNNNVPAYSKSSQDAQKNILKNCNSQASLSGVFQNLNVVKTLSFGANPNQILLISAECRPFAKTGGMADVNSEMPGEYNSKNTGKIGKDEIRVMIPLYNANEIPIEKNGKLFLRNTDNKEFEIEDTGISADFTFGTTTSHAHLFKGKNPENAVTTYFVYSPAISKDPKEYTNPYSNMYRTYSAFSAACTELLKKLPEKENFDPGILHTTDWHTAFAIENLQKEQQKPNHPQSIDGIKTVHTFHNSGYSYQGAVEPLVAMANNFAKEEADKLLADKQVKQHLKVLGINPNIDSILSFIDSKDKQGKEFYNDETKKAKLKNLNERIKELSPGKPWDKYGNYNPSLMAIRKSDLVTTVSKGFRHEMLTSEKLAPALKDDFIIHKNKLVGITNGLFPNGFDPQKLELSYDIDTFKEVKPKNKKAIQQELSKTALEENPNPKIEGYLDQNPDAMLCLLGSRYDTGQKGIDILFKAEEEFLKNPNIQLIISCTGCPEESKLLSNFRNNVLDHYPGRAVLIQDRIDMPKYMAAADAFFVPSRWEPCGLTQLQAMRMGTIPIVSKTGGLIDTVTDIADRQHATGFKTPKNLFFEKHPDKVLAATTEKAYKVFSEEKDMWNEMVGHAMSYDSSWDKAVNAYYKNVYHNPLIDSRAAQKKSSGSRLTASA